MRDLCKLNKPHLNHLLGQLFLFLFVLFCSFLARISHHYLVDDAMKDSSKFCLAIIVI